MVGTGVVGPGTGEAGIGVGGPPELFCWMDAAYEGGGGGGRLLATPVTIPVVTFVATPHIAPLGTKAGGVVPPSTGLVAGATAWAVCSTGFITWVDLTDCMMMGEWVLA